MEIKWIADTLHSVYTVPCNLEGEPVYHLRFIAGTKHIKFRYEVRSGGKMKTVNF